MTARELIKAVQNLGEGNLDKEVIMFDGPSYYTPYKVEPMNTAGWDKKFHDKILID